MSKPTQVLVIDPPHELGFKGPFTDVVTSHLHLQNPTEKFICFKVKTTAPKQYCVRPNSGLIKPGEKSIVSVMLQPVESESTLLDTERSKHKFMVQSAYAPDESVDLDTFWRTVAPTELMDSKLRVVFHAASGSVTPSPAGNNTHNESTGTQGMETPKSVKNSATPPPYSSVALTKKEHVDVNKETESELRRRGNDVSAIQQENKELRNRLIALESARSSVAVEQGMTNFMVACVALTMLLVGLIIGMLLK
ncbi:hypothetical protein L596_007991 [Steinernema carpocapsae]|uniref:Major sperm protein n=1 Tax=Steinernema carpocapsae TaxID=34508 RepID=A0A4U5PC48_STECR|nr:hypothetical protein L596_007991 [Steinernema carpocapsae]